MPQVVGKYFKLRIKMLTLTDERVKLTNEMVQGIRVVKMYAWEKTIQSKIHDVTRPRIRVGMGVRLRLRLRARSVM